MENINCLEVRIVTFTEYICVCVCVVSVTAYKLHQATQSLKGCVDRFIEHFRMFFASSASVTQQN